MSNSFAQFCINAEAKDTPNTKNDWESNLTYDSQEETIQMLRLELQETSVDLAASKKTNRELTSKNLTLHSNLLYVQQKNKELITNLEYTTKHYAEKQDELNRVYTAIEKLEADIQTLYCYSSNVTEILQSTQKNMRKALKDNTSPATRIFSDIYTASLLTTHVKATQDPKTMYYMSMNVGMPKLVVPEPDDAIISEIVANYDYDYIDEEDNYAAMGTWA
tara:strand:- start:759 stop:1418 length:660 start_codon:yes stop_codon:yes gene_type:complete